MGFQTCGNILALFLDVFTKTSSLVPYMNLNDQQVQSLEKFCLQFQRSVVMGVFEDEVVVHTSFNITTLSNHMFKF